jgi:hypothetical protein
MLHSWNFNINNTHCSFIRNYLCQTCFNGLSFLKRQCMIKLHTDRKYVTDFVDVGFKSLNAETKESNNGHTRDPVECTGLSFRKIKLWCTFLQAFESLYRICTWVIVRPKMMMMMMINNNNNNNNNSYIFTVSSNNFDSSGIGFHDHLHNPWAKLHFTAE